jgi:TRAP-type C4-dicarboxylate transport system permease large subunit
MSSFFIVVIFGWCRINPKLGPKSEKYSWPERLKTLPAVVWPIVIFLLLIGGLMNGFFTPTEAGSIGAFAVLVLSVMKRDLKFEGYIRSLRESLRTACMVLCCRSRQCWGILLQSPIYLRYPLIDYGASVLELG